MNQPNKIVHVNTFLELGDLFQASFDTIKIKLALAFVICLVVVAVIVYFFLLIGEREILLKVSPLFIGLPFLAIVGQIFRLRASCKKYFSSLSEAQRNAQFTFQDNTDGYDVATGNDFGHIAWESVSKVVEKPDYFRFYRNKFDSHILPKKGFHQASDIEVLREILRLRLGEKAKLLAA